MMVKFKKNIIIHITNFIGKLSMESTAQVHSIIHSFDISDLDIMIL